MKNAKVDVAIACSAQQHNVWWSALVELMLQEQARGIQFGQIIAVSSAMPDHNKNNSVGGLIAPAEEKDRNQRTDANRAVATQRFLAGDDAIMDRDGKPWRADWLMWFDDDTVPPRDAITRLLAHEKLAVAGLYFNPNPPRNPIAYVKDKSGVGYKALYDYPYGMLVEVDSVGMGCTLTHRSIYEKIMDAFKVFVRPNGSLLPIHKSRLADISIPQLAKQAPNVDELLVSGWYCMRVTKPGEDDRRAWPFFAMEYGRTEDHHFWELAAQVGIKPWVDTTITCGHLRPKEYKYEDYKEYLNEAKGLR